MDINAVFPSKYLRQGDLNGARPKLFISHVQLEEMISSEDDKPVLYFNGKKKGLVLNITNAHIISATYGPDTDHWAGKLVEIWHDPDVTFGGKRVGGMKVSVPTEPKKPAVEPMPDPVIIEDGPHQPVVAEDIPF